LEKIIPKNYHPFLLGVYPILALYAFNINEAQISDVYPALLLSAAAVIIVYLGLRLFTKEMKKPALILSLAIALFFSYGHIYNLFKTISFEQFTIGRHRFLLPMYGIIFLTGIYLIQKMLRDAENVTRIANFVSLALIAVPLVEIGLYGLRTRQAPQETPQEAQPAPAAGENPEAGPEAGANPGVLPDIYFIILDAYTRADTLQAEYNYDNQPFLNQLSGLGFYVAECSQSNYSSTRASLASALNLDYLINFWREDYNSYNYLRRISKSRFRITAERFGYQMIALESGIFYTEVSDADIFLARNETSLSWFERLKSFDDLNDFEILLLESTLVRSFNDFEFLRQNLDTNLSSDKFSRRRAITEFQLRTLGEIHALDGPNFIFTHIVGPHYPYVFGPNGEPILDAEGNISAEEDSRIGYPNQVTYLNSQLIPLMETIISNSEPAPVIILLGDHGPSWAGPNARSTNLTAVFLPYGEEELLYDSITPINAMRIVSNTVFGTDLKPVPDIHYQFDSRLDPRDYKIIENPGEHCAES
jgi:hypothetical protein